VIGCKGIFKEEGDVPWLKRLWCILVELPKNLSVVACKDLREGRRHFDG